ncbi:hypothetical protein DPMN_144379 [Dreissena polymorpha]|uniref:Uncharacterized protein n=1 Tax=Dreissena polymorpha TaxID=45954 RepID=A0A9D4GEW7_DREPO|nr:hypothetical protein DPMN_144379 [Dreissena polymorpha]
MATVLLESDTNLRARYRQSQTLTLTKFLSLTRNGVTEADAYPHAAGLVMGSCIIEIDRIFIRDRGYNMIFQKEKRKKNIFVGIGNLGWGFEGSSAYSVGGDSGQDGRMDRQMAEITTISPHFKKAWG